MEEVVKRRPGNPNIKNIGFGSKGRTKEQDDEYRARAKGVPKPRIWTKEKMHDLLDDMLSMFKKILIEDDKLNVGNPTKLKAESVRDLNNMTNRLMQVMVYMYPPVTSNVNLNIDVTTDAVMERLKKFKEEQVIDITGLVVQEKPEGEELDEQIVEVSDDK